jgi:drug/metabolite transporter (DMT)-like permease
VPVIGIVGGLLTALFRGGAGTCSARLTRALGPLRALALGNLIAIVTVTAAALAWQGPPHGTAGDWLRALAYGLGTVVALAAIFRAYSVAKVGLVSATVSSNGAIAALVSVAFLGEHLPAPAVAAILLTAAGVAAAALREDTTGTGPAGGSDRRGTGYALLGACGFATAVIAGSGVDELHPIWVVAAGRAVGLVLVTLPVAVRLGLPRPDRALLPYAIGSPVLDAAGFASLLVAGQHGVAVPAVLATLSAVVLAIGGVVVFRERLSRLQWLGVATTLVGVAALATTR